MMTAKEIKAACPGADADFIVAQASNNPTPRSVREAWILTLTARIENRDKELADLKVRLAGEMTSARKQAEQKLADAKLELAAAQHRLRQVEQGIGYHDN